jgi:Glycosyl-4,4'-diaponeurosporenoate acyltransferase
MKENSNKDLQKQKRMLAMYNMVPNLVWTALAVSPVFIFCYSLIALNLVLIFLAISMVALFLPDSFFDAIQLSKNVSVYEKFGVPAVNKLAQNGSLVNALMRKKFPGYKGIRFQRSSVRRLIRQTYFFEKFHFMCLVFYCLITGYAITKHLWLWAIIITVANILYNVYPNLLQQYIRVKLKGA